MKKIVRQVQGMHPKHRSAPNDAGPEIPDAETIDDGWREQLLSVLQAMSPDAFERLAQRILRESGFVSGRLLESQPCPLGGRKERESQCFHGGCRRPNNRRSKYLRTIDKPCSPSASRQ